MRGNRRQTPAYHRYLACSALLVLTAAMTAQARRAPKTERVSVSSTGDEGNAHNGAPAISASGRYVAFECDASNLVADDTNDREDILVHDRRRHTTTRVSVHSSGTEGDGSSWEPSFSASGRFVAFESVATNLVDDDTNGQRDVFVHDRKRRVTTRVSVNDAGEGANSGCLEPSISANGRYVAFGSTASNLVVGDTNDSHDVFVHDRRRGTTTRVSVDSDGAQVSRGGQGASISASGRYVAFISDASDLVDGDGNGTWDVFVRDLRKGTTERVSVDSSGTEANGGNFTASISGNGRYVAFNSLATNLVEGDTNGEYDVFVHDRVRGGTTRVSVDSSGAQADDGSSTAWISSNGRFVAFLSSATNLATGGDGLQNVFVHDRRRGRTTCVSVNTSGGAADSLSYSPALTASGRLVVFQSRAADLVTGDGNDKLDIFVRSTR